MGFSDRHPETHQNDSQPRCVLVSYIVRNPGEYANIQVNSYWKCFSMVNFIYKINRQLVNMSCNREILASGGRAKPGSTRTIFLVTKRFDIYRRVDVISGLIKIH